jgi:hypothetical protein
MTTRGFGDVPDETALKRQGSKRVVNSIAERWFTWILTSTFTIVDGEENSRDSRLFPAVVGRGIMQECNRGIIDEDVYLSIIANKSICKC